MKVSPPLQLLLLLIAASGCSCTVITGETGGNITLPCKYDFKYHGAVSVCWNRGTIPNSGCNNELVATDGIEVTQQISDRYQLLGRLNKGDVSLTIFNITEADAGRYGCRVQIPGWFNDDKHHFDLSVAPRGTISPSSSSWSSSSSSSSSWATATSKTPGHMTSTDTPSTVSMGSVSSVEKGGRLTVILVSVFFGLVFLVTAGGLFIIGRRWRRLNKLPQPQRVGFISTSSSLQLHNRNSAVDNINQIDESEYENCP